MPSLSEKTLKNWCVEVPIEPLVRVLITDDPHIKLSKRV